MKLSFLNKLLLFASFILSFIYVIYGLIKPLTYEQDLGRHLLFGKIMTSEGEVIKTNLISFTNTSFEYINTHWLSEILFYYLHDLLNPTTLIFLAFICNFLAILFLFIFSYKRVYLASLAIFLPLFAHFIVIRATARPEIFSYLFISIFVVILFKFREKYTPLVYLLIPLMALWVNLHIYFAVGLVLIFSFLLEDLVIKRRKLNTKSKKLLIVFIFSVLASFLNPNFLKGALYPAFFMSNYGIEIQENLNLFLLSSKLGIQNYIVQIGILLSSLMLLVLYRKKAFLIDWILIILFVIAAFLAFRNFYVFLLVGFYSLTKLFGFLLSDIERILAQYVNKKQHMFLKSMSYVILCLILILVIFMQYTVKSINANEAGRLEKALDFYKSNELGGPLYNSFDLGQFIAYRLYPEKVYVDARPEAYPKDFLLERYGDAEFSYEMFKAEDSRYNFNTVFLMPLYYEEIGLIKNLTKDENFSLVYLDSQVLIFVKNNEENINVIEKFEITNDSFQLNGAERAYDLLGYVLLFDEINWPKAELVAYKALSKQENGICSLVITLERRAEGRQKLKNIPHVPDVICF